MKKALFTAAILAATVSTSASAQDTWPYWYVGLSVGGTFQSDSDFTSNGASGEFGHDEGIALGASLGYIISQDRDFGRSRVELEYSNRQSDLGGVGGDVEADVVAANYYYDFTTQGSNVMPYLGAGVGAAEISVDPTNAAGASGDDTVGIYQVMAGVGYAPENLPRTELTIGYKYLGTFNDPDVNNTGAGTTEFEYDNHSVEVGAKLRF